MAGSVFISYRRVDSTAYAMCLRLELARELGQQNVLMDTSSLRGHFGLADPEPRVTAKFPPPPVFVPGKLAPEDLRKAMALLPDWRLETSPLPGKPGTTRTELTRLLEFKTYADAIAFMQAC